MAKVLMNEAECFLLKNWEEAYLLEQSMQGVRAKYKEVFQQIIEEVSKAHPELDSNFAYPTQFWESGCIGFGRKGWPEGDSGFPPGLWLWNLRLENLTSEDAEEPYACIWVSSKSARKCKLDVAAARIQLMAAAQTLLLPEELSQTTNGDESVVLIRLPSPSKAELLDSLADGDGQKFVERFVRQFEFMAKFIPAINKLFGINP